MRILLYTVFLLATISLNAQYDKGNWYLDANSGIRVAASRPGVGDLVGANATGGYFVAKNLMLGAQLQLGSLLNDEVENDFYRLNPFARYYLPSKRMARLRYFAEAGVGLLFEGNLQTNLTAGLGVEYRLAPGLLANAALRYNTEGQTRAAGYSLDLGLSLWFGDLSPVKYDKLANRKGTFMVDASVGQLFLGNLRSIDLITGAVSLRGGYFLTNNFVLEGGLSFSANNVNWESSGGDAELFSRSARFVAEAGLRYQFLSGRRFQPYLAAGLHAEHVNQFYRNSRNDTVREWKQNVFSADLKAGFLYNFNERVALDVHAGYRPVISGGRKDGGFIGGVGLKVFLGKN